MDIKWHYYAVIVYLVLMLVLDNIIKYDLVDIFYLSTGFECPCFLAFQGR